MIYILFRKKTILNHIIIYESFLVNTSSVDSKIQTDNLIVEKTAMLTSSYNFK